MSSKDDIPVSENLIKLIQQAVEQYGNQKLAAEALDTSASTVGRFLTGEIRFPSGRILEGLAQFKSEVDGRTWTPRQLMAWLWELPPDELPPRLDEWGRIRALFEDGFALLENAGNTLAVAQKKLEYLGNQASASQDYMCNSLVRILVNAIAQKGWDIARDKDYKKFCAAINASPEEDSALRLRAIATGKATPTDVDRGTIGTTLQRLGDRTPAYELALDCAEC